MEMKRFDDSKIKTIDSFLKRQRAFNQSGDLVEDLRAHQKTDQMQNSQISGSVTNRMNKTISLDSQSRVTAIQQENSANSTSFRQSPLRSNRQQNFFGKRLMKTCGFCRNLISDQQCGCRRGLNKYKTILATQRPTGL